MFSMNEDSYDDYIKLNKRAYNFKKKCISTRGFDTDLGTFHISFHVFFDPICSNDYDTNRFIVQITYDDSYGLGLGINTKVFNTSELNEDFGKNPKLKNFILAYLGDVVRETKATFDSGKYDIDDFEYIPDEDDPNQYAGTLKYNGDIANDEQERWYNDYETSKKYEGKIDMKAIFREINNGFKSIDWMKLKKTIRNYSRFSKMSDKLGKAVSSAKTKAYNEFTPTFNVGDVVYYHTKGDRYSIQVKILGINGKTAKVAKCYSNGNLENEEPFNVRISTLLKDTNNTYEYGDNIKSNQWNHKVYNSMKDELGESKVAKALRLLKENNFSIVKGETINEGSNGVSGANAVASALAKELGYAKKQISACLEGRWAINYEHFEPDWFVEFNDDERWLVYDNHQSAYDAAVDDLEEQFREDSAILGSAIEYFGIDTFLEYLNCNDEDELDNIRSLYDELGKEEFAETCQNRIVPEFGYDYRKFAEYSIDQLGIAWHIAQYDNKEVELRGGKLAYRVE